VVIDPDGYAKMGRRLGAIHVRASSTSRAGLAPAWDRELDRWPTSGLRSK
jgi:hypothetical protein